MAQFGGRGQRLESFVRKPVAQQLAHAVAKLLAGDAPRLAALRGSEDFEFSWARVSEPRDVQHNSRAVLLTQLDHAPDQALLWAPQVQQDGFAAFANLVLHPIQPCQPLPVLADL